MKRNQTKRMIYVRTFSALFAAYLLLMIGFSIFLLAQQNKVELLKFGSSAMYLGHEVDAILQDHLSSEYQITDTVTVKKEFIRNLSYYPRRGIELAVFSRDYDLIFSTKGDWLCSYTEYQIGTTYYTGYATLNPNDWFGEEDVRELEEYYFAEPEAKKKGDISGYSLDLKGFWLDEETLIPDQITVTTMYAVEFDENGQVTSSSGSPDQAIVYESNAEDRKDLPYHTHGGIQSINPMAKKQEVLRSMVTDKERVRKAANSLENLSEQVNLVTYRYYIPVPYQHMIKSEQESVFSEFWTVCACEVNLLEQCGLTLLFVWVSCFVTFFVAAWILSVQTYKIYQKREAFEQYRSETTNALAHELKTPLSIISGYAQNLMEQVHTEKRDYYAASIHDNVNRMDKIIREMLELSRLESGMVQHRYEDVVLRELSLKCIECYRQVCIEKDITASVEGDATIKADPSLMERVLDNFFINALEHTPPNGSIQIKIADHRFTFFNSGSHISEKEISEIWQPFKKGGSKGTGLGLSISREILEQYQFTYGASNTDQGVVFWFQWN